MSAKKALNIKEDFIVLSVGQFIYRKGFDVLINVAVNLPKEIGFYFVGDTAPEEYLQIVDENDLKNIHFIGFAQKELLKNFYKASDVFVLPTREDIWGLVINEAMTYGLPIISTNRCIAALELISEGNNGWIVNVDDRNALSECLGKIYMMPEKDRNLIGFESQRMMASYTIETMVQAHKKHLEEYWSRV